MRTRERGGNLLVWGGILVASMVAVGGYVLMADGAGLRGFPLDDAWIHQTYGRNLAILGEWSFLPGEISAGSTAPLWSALLALGRVLRLDYWVWTIGLGWLCLAGVGVAGLKLFKLMAGVESGTRFLWVGVFLVGEWHLVWAAVSGMETLLFCGGVLLLFYLFARYELSVDNRNTARWRSWFIIGLLIGGLVWVRPDGLTMLGPAFLLGGAEKLKGSSRRTMTTNFLVLAAGFGLLMIPYLVFNQTVSGSLMPNTFYAKQAEYAARLEAPFLERAFQLYKLPLIGAGVLLLPGVCWMSVETVRRRLWSVGGAIIWWLGYTFIFVTRLPLYYQHGRYLIPTMPVYFVLGLAGTFILMKIFASSPYRRRLFTLGSAVSLVGVWMVFYIVGGRGYVKDVGVIETEMVAAAQWTAANIPSDALVAAHDIGALGYFGERQLLDLAGLVSPEVIPFIRDEQRLSEYMNKQGVDFLVIFPSWYPELARMGDPVYQTNGEIAPGTRGENMVVYRWISP